MHVCNTHTAHTHTYMHIYIYIVRCEKASAVVRATGAAREVYHLQGGIHKYLDAFAEDGLWRGRNFVFDRRGTLVGANEATKNPSKH
jgi:predicted sulfurtransferase